MYIINFIYQNHTQKTWDSVNPLDIHNERYLEPIRPIGCACFLFVYLFILNLNTLGCKQKLENHV